MGHLTTVVKFHQHVYIGQHNSAAAIGELSKRTIKPTKPEPHKTKAHVLSMAVLCCISISSTIWRSMDSPGRWMASTASTTCWNQWINFVTTTETSLSNYHIRNKHASCNAWGMFVKWYECMRRGREKKEKNREKKREKKRGGKLEKLRNHYQ